MARGMPLADREPRLVAGKLSAATIRALALYVHAASHPAAIGGR